MATQSSTADKRSFVSLFDLNVTSFVNQDS
jgi:hypothetical protein